MSICSVLPRLMAEALFTHTSMPPKRTAVARTAAATPQPSFAEAWRDFSRTGQARRRLVALGLGTIAFSMQDILLEPYGGQVLHLAVSTTTTLSAVLAAVQAFIEVLRDEAVRDRIRALGMEPAAQE